jgi:VIT1/CCC1 family predicted Fe2+/Mn2+ transporter
MMLPLPKPKRALFVEPPMSPLLSDPFVIRNLVYGLEDSLISTTGMIAGITLAGLPNAHIVVAGLVLILVEALSMAYGAFVSEGSFLAADRRAYRTRDVLLYAGVMLLSYVAAGLLVLVPYLLNLKTKLYWTLGLALAALYLLLRWTERQREPPGKRAPLLTAVGAGILGVTVGVGRLLRL